MDPSQVHIPPLKNLTTQNITPNTILINSNNPSPRFKYILTRLVTHLHDFARETRLSTPEWNAGIQFLTAVGQMCTDVRQEFILLSDVLGLSLLVDGIDHPKPEGSTEGTVLGPFHVHDAPPTEQGGVISQDPEGEPCLVVCSVKDTAGRPVAGAKVDIWEADSTGHYDVQRPELAAPDGRCVMESDSNGKFWFKAIVPVSYPIPHDGPVGQLLKTLQRHPFRPAHMHFMFDKAGYDKLITALYLRGDKYENSDAVFGVKDSLVVDLKRVNREMAKEYGAKEGEGLIEYEFVLVSEKEAGELREKLSKKALERLGMKVRIWNGLPVEDVD